MLAPALTVVVGVTSALVFGGADFLGGIASRRMAAIRVTAISGVVGVLVLLLAYPLVGGAWSAKALFWGSLSGVTGAVAISLLYASLAIGPMSILSPLTAVVSAIVPMTFGLIQGERLGPIGYIALVAVVLVGFVKEKNAVRPSLRGILMAIGSGAAIGAFLILIDQTPDDSGLVPLIANRAVSGLILTLAVGVLWLRSHKRTGSSRPDRTTLVLAIVCGIVDAIANMGLLLGLRLGDLTVMSVLTALYPAGTIILAAIVLKERIAPVQVVGLVLALLAAGLLAVA